VDRLHGGTGNDTMTGGQGVDHFVFAKGDNVDVVTDFTEGTDQLFLDDGLWGGGLSVADMLDKHASAWGSAGIQLTFDGGDKIILLGITDPNALINDISLF
jgi:serralysin